MKTAQELELDEAKEALASASRARSRAIIKNPLGLDLQPYNDAITAAQARVRAARQALLLQQEQGAP